MRCADARDRASRVGSCDRVHDGPRWQNLPMGARERWLCPADSSSSSNHGDSPPSFHAFADPRFVGVGEAQRVLVYSYGNDYSASEELALTPQAAGVAPGGNDRG